MRPEEPPTAAGGPSRTRLAAGTPEHKAQRWLDYQARHPERFPKPTVEIDPKWSKQYDTIIANKPAGGAFESAAPDTFGFPKNEAMLIQDGAESGGFIPDAVEGAAAVLEWGLPYRFVEVKGRADMPLTGNLQKMIKYVERTPGAFLTVIFRSETAAGGATRLTGPLEDTLRRLIESRRARILGYPP